MRRFVLRICVLCVAVLLVTTAIVASDHDTAPVDTPTKASAHQTVAIADQGGMGVDLALGGIVLGGAMVFLFRPKRRTVN